MNEDGRAWREQDAGRVAPGDRVELAASLPPAAQSDALSLREAQLLARARRCGARGRHPASPARRAGRSAGRGFRRAAALPPPPAGAEDLRFASQTLELGLAPDASDRLAVRGPLPPGESILALRYHLPAPDGAVALALRFPLQVPLLSVFATDTGVRVEAEPPAPAPQLPQRGSQLPAPRRPSRSAPGSPSSSRSRASTPQRPLPMARARRLRGAAGGVRDGLPDRAAALAATPSPRLRLAARFARGGRARVGARGAARSRGGLRHRQARRRGSRADAERAARARGRAARGRARRAARRAAPPAAPPAVASCPSCAAATAPGARFCSSCGVRLGPLPAGAGDAAG